jgi:hypothetical protein
MSAPFRAAAGRGALLPAVVEPCMLACLAARAHLAPADLRRRGGPEPGGRYFDGFGICISSVNSVG